MLTPEDCIGFKDAALQMGTVVFRGRNTANLEMLVSNLAIVAGLAEPNCGS
jgi:hypothetical protein